jgi:hypothetical protein
MLGLCRYTTSATSHVTCVRLRHFVNCCVISIQNRRHTVAHFLTPLNDPDTHTAPANPSAATLQLSRKINSLRSCQTLQYFTIITVMKMPNEWEAGRVTNCMCQAVHTSSVFCPHGRQQNFIIIFSFEGTYWKEK